MTFTERSVETRLMEVGEAEGFDSYRRPGIICGAGKRLVCYYEAQRFAPERRQQLFCRVSDDAGESWSERILLAEGGATGMLHNIMMAYARGRYYCLWNVQYRQLWLRESADGVHWSDPRDLTRSLWRADCDYAWNAFGIGSGHCTVLSSGRILIPTWFTTGGDAHKPSAFANIYTDDAFESLHIGRSLRTNAEYVNPNEGAIVELSDGTVLATIRHDNEQRARLFAHSRGGVEEWKDVRFRPDLPDPICHASMLAIGEEGARRILFCNCANADPDWKQKHEAGQSRYLWSDDARKQLTLRFSDDDGGHFSRGAQLAEKGGYSDLAYADGTVVCIYETSWNLEETCVVPHDLGISRIALKDLLQAE